MAGSLLARRDGRCGVVCGASIPAGRQGRVCKTRSDSHSQFQPPAAPQRPRAGLTAAAYTGGMRRYSAVAGVALVLCLLAALLPAQEHGAGAVLLIELDGGIGPASTDHVRRGLDRAATQGATAVVLRIDTPGGLDAATRDINQAILASPVPVIGYVAPEGARAASAGTYILYATHLAAMAPATALGAATPVSIGGGDAGPAPTAPETEDAGNAGDDETPTGGQSTMARKVGNDAAAYLRGLAELRGRDVAFAEAAVREAASLSASQALERGVVELVATDLDDLLRQADGREVRLGRQTVALATAGAAVETFEPGWRTRLLAVIADPSIAYFLLLIGLYGLVFEGYNPGVLVPGVVGAIALLLALYAMQVLPVNYAGVALIVLGVALMTAELFLPSFGALGIGGVVALVAGSVMLFDSEVPGYGLPLATIAGVGVLSAAAFLATLLLAVRARRQPVLTGRDELLGHEAIALADFQGRGQVRIRGETWQADSASAVRAGQSVRVTGLDGLVLKVRP